MSPKTTPSAPSASAAAAQRSAVRAGAVAAHQLEERAVLAVGPLLLVEERQPLGVELLEPLVPGDPLERLLAGAAREVDAQDAGVAVVTGAADPRGSASVGLDPAPDLLVVSRRVRGGSHVGESS